MEIAGNEEIAEGLQRAEAQPDQHLGNQDGAQHDVTGDIAQAIQELAREAAGFSGGHTVSRGRSLNRSAGKEDDNKRKGVEDKRPDDPQAEDERGSYRRPKDNRQTLNGLERLQRVILPLRRHNVLNKGKLGRNKKLGKGGEQRDINIKDAEPPQERQSHVADEGQREICGGQHQQNREDAL